jgi:signal transduction histidine kinase
VTTVIDQPRSTKLHRVVGLANAFRCIGLISAGVGSWSAVQDQLIPAELVWAVMPAFAGVYAVIAVASFNGWPRTLARPLVLFLDVASVSVANIVAAGVLAPRQLYGMNVDVLWAAFIGCAAIWAAVYGWRIGLAVTIGAALVQIAMGLANDYDRSTMSTGFIVSRLVWVGLGVLVTSAALRISGVSEDEAQRQGAEQGAVRALHEMHRETLQGVKAAILELQLPGDPQRKADRTLSGLRALDRHLRRWPQLATPAPPRVDLAVAVHDVVTERLSATSVTCLTEIGSGLHTVEPGVVQSVCHALAEISANVAQHSAARRVTISASRTDDQVRVVVDDDGCGFDGWHASCGGSLGLAAIEGALASIGGVAELRTVVGIGTRWTLLAPSRARPEVVADSRRLVVSTW